MLFTLLTAGTSGAGAGVLLSPLQDRSSVVKITGAKKRDLFIIMTDLWPPPEADAKIKKLIKNGRRCSKV